MTDQLGAVVADAQQRGAPRRAMIAVNSRATRAPDSDVSATRQRHSRGKSSTTTRTRNRRPSVNVSAAKSSDQRWFGPCGSVIGALVPKARFDHRDDYLQPFHARHPRSSLWFMRIPSRSSSSFKRRQPKSPTFRGKLLQPRPCRRVIRTPMAVAHRAAIGTDDRTGPPLADPVRLARSGHRGSPSGGRHHFLDVMSFSTALSSIASASSFFSFAFSPSSSFSRFASEMLMPPNFAFQA